MLPELTDRVRHRSVKGATSIVLMVDGMLVGGFYIWENTGCYSEFYKILISNIIFSLKYESVIGKKFNNIKYNNIISKLEYFMITYIFFVN